MNNSQLYSSDIEFLHIELTNRCNARCPMCSRTDNPLIEDAPADISIGQFKQMFQPEFLAKLKAIVLCGNFGDPAVAKDCIEIHEYLLEVNPNIIPLMHTNGGVRNEEFWKALGRLYAQTKGFINFHIDGLEDTNHNYRAGVDFHKTIANAEAAISTGARCNWVWIPFEYNQHQIAQAQCMSAKMGFYKFVQLITARFKDDPQPVVWFDRRTKTNKQLAPTTLPELQLIKQPPNLKQPNCRAMKLKELYVSARGIAMPCCWMGSRYETDSKFKSNIVVDADPNLHTRLLSDILTDPLFEESIPRSWSFPNYLSDVCMSKCTNTAPVQEWLIDGQHINENDILNWLSTI